MSNYEHVAGSQETSSPQGNWEHIDGDITSGKSWLSSTPAKIGANLIGGGAGLAAYPPGGPWSYAGGAQLAELARREAANEQLQGPVENAGEYLGNVMLGHLGGQVAGSVAEKLPQAMAPFLQRVLPAAASGGTIGGIGGVLSNPQHPFVGAAQGAGTGIGLGVGAGALQSITDPPLQPQEPALSKFPTVEELTNATPKQQVGMTPPMRQGSFALQKHVVEAPFADQIAERSATGKDLTITLKEDASRITDSIVQQKERALADLARQQGQSDITFENQKYQGAQDVQARLPQALKGASMAYGTMYDEGMELAKGTLHSQADVQATLQKWVSQYPELLQKNPNIVNDILQQLGFRPSTGVNLGSLIGSSQVSNQGTTIPAESISGAGAPQGSVSTEQLSNFIKSVRPPPTSGTYSYADMMADDLADHLGNVVKQNAPPEAIAKLNEANKFWSQYKPVQKQAVSQFDPFTNSPIGLKPGMTTLGNAAQTQMLPGATSPTTDFVGQLESYMGMKPGDMTADLRSTLSSMSAEQQRVIADNLQRDQMIQDVRKAGSTGVANVKSGIGADISGIKSAREQAIGNLIHSQQQVSSQVYDKNQKNNLIRWIIRRVSMTLGWKLGGMLF